MSLFRKPKKIQRRVFRGDDDVEEDDGEPQPPPPPIISKEKKENKPAKIKTKSLLSFADEEDDGEVFKVKKSKQSSRLIKKREKEKKQAPDNNSYKVDIHFDEDKPNNHQQKPRKKVTLEGLILSGRDALAADGKGDLSDEPSGEEEEEEDDRGFHRYRAETVRAALAPGVIPDAALIHAARKTRQQARELGDFVPLPQPQEAPGSRLIRDDDGSGDDDDEGRIQVRGLELPSDKPKRGTAAAPSNEELDSEPDEWEEQQIKKAMPAINDVTNVCDMSTLYSLAPPPPPPPLHPHLRPLLPLPESASELVNALATRLEELKTDRDQVTSKRIEVLERLAKAQSTKTNCLSRKESLAASYRRAQTMRGYLTDLVECLDEKMPELEALEAKALALHKKRCDFLMERRRADVRDQAQDVLAMTGRSTKAPEDEAKQRRAAEREGRRRARRLARGSAPHRDGDSSDDDLPRDYHHQIHEQREEIRQAASVLFADALPAWRSLRGVARRLARWKRRDRALYVDTYLPACLPRLLAPYVRTELILWNPIADEDNEDYERMDWYKCLMMYGVTSEQASSDSSSDDEEDPPEIQENIRDDPDLMLVPNILAKVVVPKIVELIESSWDPMCVRACIRLRGVVTRLACLPGASLSRLAAALDNRLAQAAPDVFLPCLPPNIIEGPGGSFWRRCLGANVRLLRATLSLTAPPPMLKADKYVLKLIDEVCLAAGAAPPALSVAAGGALCDALPRQGALRTAALVRLAALAQLALGRLDCLNPTHMKPIEQAKAIIAEAKSAAD